MLFGPKLAELNARITDLTGQLTLATDNGVVLLREKGELETRVKDLEAAQTDAVPKADHEAAIKVKTDEIASLNEKLAAAEKTVDTKVVEKIASAGVPAIVRDPGAVDSATKTEAGGAGRTKTTWARDF